MNCIAICFATIKKYILTVEFKTLNCYDSKTTSLNKSLKMYLKKKNQIRCQNLVFEGKILDFENFLHIETVSKFRFSINCKA